MSSINANNNTAPTEPARNFDQYLEHRVQLSPLDKKQLDDYVGTGGTGGDATELTLSVTELKAITDAVVDDIQFVYDATYGWNVYHYKAGTAAESAPDIYRPDSYAAVTNEFVWERA